MTYFLNVGTALGVNIAGKGDYNVQYTDSSWSINISNDKLGSRINPIAASLLISAGTEYNLSGNASIMASLFFNNSFLDVLKDLKDNQKNVIDVGSRLNVVGINVGIFF